MPNPLMLRLTQSFPLVSLRLSDAWLADVLSEVLGACTFCGADSV
ncbi:MAG: hypothetical protein ABGX69_08100 [Methylococcales bacterium]|jgi:hypothetical protein